MTTKAYRSGYDAINWSIPREPLPKAKERKGRAFYIVPDLQPYQSPIDGKVISSRSKHRDHMREHQVVEVGNERLPTRKRIEMPDPRHDIKEAFEKLQSGYRPHIDTYRE